VIVPILVALGIPVALHAAWRVRYGYPPPHLPRVLCFHKICARFCWEGTWTTPARFAAIIDRLRDHGYAFIDEATFLSALDSPRADASRSVFLTFDDGYAHLVDTALPILGERGIPFHVFLVADYAGRSNTWDLALGRPPVRHLDWEHVREMAARGVTFGSHTSAHMDLTRMTPGAVAADLARSRSTIEGATGTRVRTLSYPFGRYNDGVRRVAREAGFEAAFSLYPAHRNGTVDPYALRREGVYIIDAPRTVESKLAPNFLYGLEEMKCRAINAVARLTPLLKNRGVHEA